MRVILLGLALVALAVGMAPAAEANHGEGCDGDPSVAAVCYWHANWHECWSVYVLGSSPRPLQFCLA